MADFSKNYFTLNEGQDVRCGIGPHRVEDTCWEEADKDYGASITLVKSLQADNAHEHDIAEALRKRSVWGILLERWEEALEDLQQCINIWEKMYAEGELESPFALARAYNHRAPIFEELERYDEALRDYERAIEISGSLLCSEKFVDELALCRLYFFKGMLLQKLRRSNEALANYTEAIKVGKRLLRGRTSVEVREMLTRTYHVRGVLQREANRPAKAIADFTAGVEICEKLKGGGEFENLLSLAKLYQDRASLQERRRPGTAIKDYNYSIELYEQLHMEDRILFDKAELVAFATCYSSRAALIDRTEAAPHYEALLDDYQRSLDLMLSIGGDADAQDESMVGKIHQNISTILIKMERKSEAMHSLDESIEIWERLLKDSSFDDKAALSVSYYNRSMLWAEQSNYEAAISDASRYIDLVQELLRKKRPVDKERLAEMFGLRAVWRAESLGQNKEAVDDLNRAIKILEQINKRGKLKDAERLPLLYHNRGLLLQREGKYKAVLASLNRSIEVREMLAQHGLPYDESGLAATYISRANYYLALGCCDEQALEDANTGIAHYEKRYSVNSEMAGELAMAYHFRGVVNHLLEHYDEARADTLRAVQLGQQVFGDGNHGQVYKLAASYNNLAMEEIMMENYDAAVSTLTLCIDTCRDLDSDEARSLLANCLYNRARAYLMLDEVEKAREDLRDCLTIIENTHVQRTDEADRLFAKADKLSRLIS